MIVRPSIGALADGERGEEKFQVAKSMLKARATVRAGLGQRRKSSKGGFNEKDMPFT